MVDSYTKAKEKKGKPPAAATVGKPKPAASVVDGNKNLNTLADGELKAIKAQMDVGFSANQKKPGDAGYQYDKRVRVFVISNSICADRLQFQWQIQRMG